MKVKMVTPYRVVHLQRYGVTVRGNITSVYPPLEFGLFCVRFCYTLWHMMGDLLHLQTGPCFVLSSLPCFVCLNAA
jgi:hypothetical protein